MSNLKKKENFERNDDVAQRLPETSRKQNPVKDWTSTHKQDESYYNLSYFGKLAKSKIYSLHF